MTIVCLPYWLPNAIDAADRHPGYVKNGAALKLLPSLTVDFVQLHVSYVISPALMLLLLLLLIRGRERLVQEIGTTIHIVHFLQLLRKWII